MHQNYDKPFQTYEEQLGLLVDRGLGIGDRDSALAALERIGYYALGGYLYSMRLVVNGKAIDTFLPEATLEQALALYEFDKKLRLLCLDPLELIERTLKVSVAYSVGRDDSLGHHNSDLLQPKYVGEWHEWLGRHRGKLDRKHEVISQAVRKYGKDLPIWIAVEAMDFGDVAKLLKYLRFEYQIAVAHRFGVLRADSIVSWMHTMSSVRNTCAHHDRFWNAKLVNAPKKARGPEAGYLNRLNDDSRAWRLPYVAILLMVYFATQVAPESIAGNALRDHLMAFPAGCGADLADMGAPANWHENSLWSL